MASGALEPVVGQGVEAAVVEPADVRDEGDADSLRLVRATAAVVAAAGCREEREDRGEEDCRETSHGPLVPLPHGSETSEGGPSGPPSETCVRAGTT